MKKIKVYLKSPLGFSDSLYYKNIINFPPKEVSYKTNLYSAEIITKKNIYSTKRFFKNNMRKLLEITNLPLLNQRKIENNDCEIIHCAHCLPKTEKNWVADFEAPWQFWISGRDTKFGKKRFLKIVSEKNCKKLLAWTETAKEEMVKKFPEIRNKVEVVNYAMPFISFYKNKNKKNINLLFSARYFYGKGGLHALEAIHRLTKKYKNVRGTVISSVPNHIKIAYSINKKIEFLPILPQRELFEKIYPDSDILIYPGYSDTFGFGLVEAMNFGMPIVTVNGYARKDIVTNGKTGFIISTNGFIDYLNIKKNENAIIDKIVKKTSKIIENKNLREKISKNCIEEVKNGKFSIRKRNEKLGKIYTSLLKD